MQITVELKKALCKIEQNNIGLIFMFILGYIIFSLYNKYQNNISEEEKTRRYRKSVKYLNKYQRENEEFFIGSTENEGTIN
jgi:hypothetical protein